MGWEQQVHEAMDEMFRLKGLWVKEARLAAPLLGVDGCHVEQEVFRLLNLCGHTLRGILAVNRDIEDELARLQQAAHRAWVLLGVDYDWWMADSQRVREARGAYGDVSLVVYPIARPVWDEVQRDLGCWRDEITMASQLGVGVDEPTELRKYEGWVCRFTVMGGTGGQRVLSAVGAAALLMQVTDARVELRGRTVLVLKGSG